jgi:hypothetical protein
MNDEAGKPNEGDGGRGEEPYLTPVQQNKIYGMMIRQQWPITQTDKIQAVEVTVKNMDDENKRVVNQAVRNLVAMNAQNMEQEQRDNPQAHRVLHHHSGTVGITAVRQELLNDPAYLEFQRQRAVAEDANAGAVCPPRQQGAVEDAAPPDLPGPSANGHG